MKDLHEFSKLPDDADYWAALEARVVAAAGVPAGGAAGARSEWWRPLAAHAWGLGGLAAAAAVATLLLVPVPRASAAPDPLALALLRAPVDVPALLPFAASPAPPAVAALLVARAAGGER